MRKSYHVTLRQSAQERTKQRKLERAAVSIFPFFSPRDARYNSKATSQLVQKR